MVSGFLRGGLLRPNSIHRGGSGLLLDRIDNLRGVYSLKRRVTAYTGNLIKLRRSTDDVEADFGYVVGANILDTAAITTWLNGATGYVTTWYDQSGQTKNATQPSKTIQPTIDLANLCVVFNATSTQYLVTAVAPGSNWSMFIKFSAVTNTGGCGMGVSAGNRFAIVPNGASGISYRYTNSVNVNPALTAGVVGFAGTKGYRNGTEEATTLDATLSPGVVLHIGSVNSGSPGSYLSGNVHSKIITADILTLAEIGAIVTGVNA